MSDESTPIELSRRKMLGGLGAIGVASAGAGLGTTAFFSDSESFEENTLTAGELDLFVHVDYEEDQGSFAQYSTPPGTYVNGGVVGEDVDGNGAVVPGEPLSIQVVDLKPGDSGEGKFCFSIVDNPSYMWMCGELTANEQNGFTDPELDVLDPDGDGDLDPDGSGQLADAMQITMSYCDHDGEVGDEIISGSLAEVMAALQTGVPLNGDGDADGPIANRPAFDGVEAPFDDSDDPVIDETCVCFEWEVPTTVGNEIQTDSVTFDFEFYAEQERHNDGTNNPCADESYAADYVNPDNISQPIPDGVARVDVSYGDEQVIYGITFDEPAGSQYSLADPNFAAANFSMPFDLDDSGNYDYQVAWNAEGGDDFLYSEVDGTPNWEKDVGPWSPVPASITAVKFGSQAVIAVPRSDLETGGNDYVFGFGASAGGEAPSVGIPVGGPYNGNDNFTSSEDGQSATLQ